MPLSRREALLSAGAVLLASGCGSPQDGDGPMIARTQQELATIVAYYRRLGWTVLEDSDVLRGRTGFTFLHPEQGDRHRTVFWEPWGPLELSAVYITSRPYPWKGMYQWDGELPYRSSEEPAGLVQVSTALDIGAALGRLGSEVYQVQFPKDLLFGLLCFETRTAVLLPIGIQNSPTLYGGKTLREWLEGGQCFSNHPPALVVGHTCHRCSPYSHRT